MQEDYEKIIAHYIAKIVPDLRLVDVSHYILDLCREHYANIADIIEAATELYFFPNHFRFAQKGDFKLEWGCPPIIMLEMEFFNQGVRSLFRLDLKHDSFAIELTRIRFGSAGEVESSSSYSDRHRLIQALNDACLRKIV